jgi:hypothetical protein
VRVGDENGYSLMVDMTGRSFRLVTAAEEDDE